MESLINHEFNELNAYFAGRFEEGGRLIIRKQKHPAKHRNPKDKKAYKSTTYQLQVYMHFHTKAEASLFNKSFGGTVYFISHRPPEYWHSKSKSKTYRWCCTATSVQDFVDLITPFILGNKVRKKLQLAKKYRQYQIQNFGRHSKIVRNGRERFYQQMKRLNK